MPEREVKYMLLVVFEVEPDDADSSLFLSNQQLDKFPFNTFRFFFLLSFLVKNFYWYLHEHRMRYDAQTWKLTFNKISG